MNSGLVECISWEQSIRNSHRDIHNTGQGKDKSRVEECEEISLDGEGGQVRLGQVRLGPLTQGWYLGGEGGHEEADKGDAAQI